MVYCGQLSQPLRPHFAFHPLLALQWGVGLPQAAIQWGVGCYRLQYSSYSEGWGCHRLQYSGGWAATGCNTNLTVGVGLPQAAIQWGVGHKTLLLLCSRVLSIVDEQERASCNNQILT